MSSLSTLWFLNLLLLLTFLMTSLFLGKDYYRERKGLVMVTIWKELNWTHLSLALDLRPLLKPLAVPRECSTRILNIKRKEISLQGTQSKYDLINSLQLKNWYIFKKLATLLWVYQWAISQWLKKLTFLPSFLYHCIHKLHHLHLSDPQIPEKIGPFNKFPLNSLEISF